MIMEVLIKILLSFSRNFVSIEGDCFQLESAHMDLLTSIIISKWKPT